MGCADNGAVTIRIPLQPQPTQPSTPPPTSDPSTTNESDAGPPQPAFSVKVEHLPVAEQQQLQQTTKIWVPAVQKATSRQEVLAILLPYAPSLRLEDIGEMR